MTDRGPKRPGGNLPGGSRTARPATSREAPEGSQARHEQIREGTLKSITQFEAFKGVLQERMRLIRFVLGVTELSRAQWGPAVRTLKPDLVNLGAAILQRLLADPTLHQRLRIALERYDSAAALVAQAQRFLATETMFDVKDVREVVERLSRLNPAERALRREAGKDFDLKELKTKIFLLSTYDLLFKNDPVLNQMFPWRPRGPALAPVKPVREAPAVPRTERDEPAADTLMAKVMRHFRRGPPESGS